MTITKADVLKIVEDLPDTFDPEELQDWLYLRQKHNKEDRKKQSVCRAS